MVWLHDIPWGHQSGGVFVVFLHKKKEKRRLLLNDTGDCMVLQTTV